MSAAAAFLSELTKQNPWPGLRAFGENDRDFFFGREREGAELLSLIQRAPVVVLYGQSGLGKTSLLQAGLFPKLKALNFFPVRVRFDHADDAPPLARQITLAVVEELDRAQINGPRPVPGETLWEYFHRRDLDFWGPRNRLLTPVIVLDQFEEIFTLGHRTEKSNARVAEFQKELEAVLEHRPPDAVRERLEADPDKALHYDLKRQAVKFVITLREDFLADLDPWRERMPSLLPNRLRLERMTGGQALEVVQRAGSDVVDLAVARDIVDFVSTSRIKRSSSLLEQRDVDPALLSVVCDGLNLSRISSGKTRITADLLTAEREEIMKDFYERTFEGIDPRVRDWVEDHLLTSSGYRDRAALDDAAKLGLPEADFDVLVNRRLLHREERSGVLWLELTHDSLTDPASRSRAVREQRMQAEAAKEREKAAAEREAQVRSKLRRTQLMAAVCGMLVVIAALAMYFANKANHVALTANQTARQEANKSLRSYQTATELTKGMGLNIADTGIPTATADKNIQEVERAYSDLSHQGTLSELQHAQFLTKAADAYYRVGYIRQGLEESQKALDLLEKTGGLGVPGDVLQLARAEALYFQGDGLRATGHLSEARRCFDDAIKLAMATQTPDLKLAAERVNVLSRIDLGRVDEEGWAYPSAHAHLREALDIVKALASDADEILSWNALALQEMGASQTEYSESQRYYTDAVKVIKNLIAHDPENLRWKRLFAHMTYLQGITAMNLEQLDEAKQLLEQSQSISQDLCNRDPLNLDWRLGLVQSLRGLGRVHEDSGEWDLSQEVLKKAETRATELTEAQPTWTRALYEAGAITFTLGDVLRAKYSDEADVKEQKLLLQGAYSLYSKAREWSEKGIQVTPENMDFVRLAALSIGRQGFVLDKEGVALDTTLKGNQEEKNKKETEALKRYAEAFEKLRPIERATEDEPRSLTDEAYLHWWVGDLLLELTRTKDAVSAYKEAVSKAKDAVKKSPAGDNYDLLSLTYGVLGDAYASANQFDEAAANYRLAEEAIHRALRLKPESAGFHVQEARIQGQLFGISFKRNDLSMALNEVDLGITTTLAGLKTDYSDPSLNKDISYFKAQLGKIQTALRTYQPAEGSAVGQSHVSPEQSKALLRRIDVLLKNIAPEELLDHNRRQVSWTLHPLMPGAWRDLADAEREPALKSVLALNKNFTRDQVWGIRRLPLGFYDDVALFEAEVVLANGTHGIAAFLQHGTKTIPVDGTPEPAHTLNRESQLKLDDAARATDYMRFFMGMLQQAGGRLNLIDSPDDIKWRSEATAEMRASIVAGIKPLTVEPISDRGWQAIATLQYYGYLRKASIHLSRFGEIEFEGENRVSERLPIYIEVFDSGIRVLRTLEWLDNHVLESNVSQAEQQLKTNPNDAAALKQLPSQYAELDHWKEAVEAEKNWVAFLQRQTKRDDDWSKNLFGAYVTLSWYQLIAHDFTGALASSAEARKLDPSRLIADEAYAHALLFQGGAQEAEALYLGNVGKKMDSTSNQTWEQSVLADFSSLEKEGITNPEIARIRKLLIRTQNELLETQFEQQLKTNPNDEYTLRQLPNVYYNLGRWNEAVDAEKTRIAFIKRQTKHDSDWSKTLEGAYVSLSWYQLFARDFKGALTSSEEAINLDHTDLAAETNHAHSLLFLDRAQEAEAIYLQHRGEKVFTGSDEKWEQAILTDFDDLEKAGVTHPEIARLRVILKPPSK